MSRKKKHNKEENAGTKSGTLERTWRCKVGGKPFSKMATYETVKECSDCPKCKGPTEWLVDRKLAALKCLKQADSARAQNELE